MIWREGFVGKRNIFKAEMYRNYWLRPTVPCVHGAIILRSFR